LIGTTNLDAQRPVLWDMGRIAAADTAEAISLFRQVLLASATVPGAFAPVGPLRRATWRAGGATHPEVGR